MRKSNKPSTCDRVFYNNDDKENDFTFMTTCSASAGKKHYSSTEVDQLKLWAHWSLHILVSCGDYSSHTCGATHKATTHT
eukprot:3151911-Ditylum_brightwellii.AAC.1